MKTGTKTYNMIQSVEIDGVKNKHFTEKDFKNIKSVAIKEFSSNGEWWTKEGSQFADAIETQLIKIGLDTYKYNNKINSKTLKKLKRKGIQAIITGTAKSSIKYSDSFGSGESKILITGVSFSIISTKNGKTMASINLNYKKGVSDIEAAKDIAKALKALIKYPNMDIKKAFEKVSKNK